MVAKILRFIKGVLQKCKYSIIKGLLCTSPNVFIMHFLRLFHFPRCVKKYHIKM